jgi:hypothetical protein
MSKSKARKVLGSSLKGLRIEHGQCGPYAKCFFYFLSAKEVVKNNQNTIQFTQLSSLANLI